MNYRRRFKYMSRKCATVAVVCAYHAGFSFAAGVEIMAFGDSITALSYPSILQQLLQGAGFTVTVYNEGRGGYSIGPDPSQADDWTGGKGNLVVIAGNLIRQRTPDIVLINIGTNDLSGTVRTPGYCASVDGPGRVKILMDSIYSAKPDVMVMLSSIMPWKDNHSASHAFNEGLRGVVKSFLDQGKKAWFVDLHNEAGITNADLSDVVHPTTGGCNKMAQCFSLYVRSYLQKGWYPRNIKPIVSIASPTNEGWAEQVPSTVTLTASASDVDGTVASITMLNGTQVLGTASSAPYTFSLPVSTAGRMLLRAVAVDDSGATDTSLALNLNTGAYAGIQSTKTSTAPAVDGAAEAVWQIAPASAITKVASGAVASAADLSATIKSLWDVQNLYLLIQVKDNVKSSTGTSAWEKDGAEICIDADKSAAVYYDGDDFLYRMIYNSTAVTESKHNAVTSVTYRTTSTADGYIIEASIPWQTIKAVPLHGRFIGFDVQINDNDGGGNKGKISCYNQYNTDWVSPYYLGTLKLVDPNTDVMGEPALKPRLPGIVRGNVYSCSGRHLKAGEGKTQITIKACSISGNTPVYEKRPPAPLRRHQP